MQSAAKLALMPLLIFFAVNTAAATHNAFSGSDSPKIVNPLGGSQAISNTWFLGITLVYPSIDISISSAVFEGLMNVTNVRQTHKHTDILITLLRL